MTLDKVPIAEDLYIGGIFSMRRGKAIEEYGITHVVTALNVPIDSRLFEKCQKHLVIDIEDDESEDILQYFAQSNAFIDDAFKNKGKVFVHCAMGKSRSATLVVAYLMISRNMGVDEALALLRTTRPFVEPNEGFMEQLQLFEKMGRPQDPGEHPVYQRWLFQRELARSRELHQPPDNIIFEDEAPQADASDSDLQEISEYRCRKCRKSLATSIYTVHVKPKYQQKPCSHVFVEPLSWMKGELEQGKLDGKLECPNEKCRQNVGKYAWQGNRCTCNEWVVPGISLHRSKIDEVKVKRKVPGAEGGGGGKADEDGKGTIPGKI